MTQLILENVYLPETRFDQYKAYPETLSQQVDMISGRRVMEVRGDVWKIEYSIEYVENDLVRQILAILRQQNKFTVNFLPDNSDEMLTSEFLLESMNSPTFVSSYFGTPIWHNFSFTLREVKPHD